MIIMERLQLNDVRSKRRMAVVCLKRIKMKDFGLSSANLDDKEFNKINIAANNASDGKRIVNSGQKSINSQTKRNNMCLDLDLIEENMNYIAQKTQIELTGEALENDVSSDDDYEELNINDINWQCEFLIDTNDAGSEDLPSSTTIENNDIEKHKKEEEKPTCTKKPKRKSMPKKEKSQCPYCLGFYQVMVKHLRSCSARSGHICKYCDSLFETSTRLNEHVEKMHPEGLYACHICFATFENIKLRGIHVRIEHSNIKCEQCGRQFRSKIMRDEHIERRHTEIINKKCELCKKVSKTEFLYRRHLKQHEMADQLKCKFCGKMFARVQYKLNHERVHAGETPFLCEFCGLGLNSLVDLNLHKKGTHLNENDGKEFRPRRRMWSCFRQKPAEPVRFQCALCPRKFGTSYGLNNHLKLHTEDRKFVCEQCGNGFHRLEALREHERRIHTKAKRFSCPECDKMFYARAELKHHMLIHQEERPFECPHCPARFKQQNRLKIHLVSHSSAKPYVCNSCGKAYKSASNLGEHFQNIHTADEIKEIERKLLCNLEKSMEANRISKINEESMINELD